MDPYCLTSLEGGLGLTGFDLDQALAGGMTWCRFEDLLVVYRALDASADTWNFYDWALLTEAPAAFTYPIAEATISFDASGYGAGDYAVLYANGGAGSVDWDNPHDQTEVPLAAPWVDTTIEVTARIDVEGAWTFGLAAWDGARMGNGDDGNPHAGTPEEVSLYCALTPVAPTAAATATSYDAAAEELAVTIDESALTLAAQDLAPSYSDADTKCLISFNGADESTTMTDRSASAHTITALALAKVDQAAAKFGNASAWIGNSSISISHSSDFDLTGDVTIEAWVRFDTADLSTPLYIWYKASAMHAEQCFVDADEKLRWKIKKFGVWIITAESSTVTITPDTWHHVAFVREFLHYRIYWDGVEVCDELDESPPVTFTPSSSVEIILGPASGDTWVDEFRYVKGVAKYPEERSDPVGLHTNGANNFITLTTPSGFLDGLKNDQFAIVAIMRPYASPTVDNRYMSAAAAGNGNPRISYRDTDATLIFNWATGTDNLNMVLADFSGAVGTTGAFVVVADGTTGYADRNGGTQDSDAYTDDDLISPHATVIRLGCDADAFANYAQADYGFFGVLDLSGVAPAGSWSDWAATFSAAINTAAGTTFDPAAIAAAIRAVEDGDQITGVYWPLDDLSTGKNPLDIVDDSDKAGWSDATLAVTIVENSLATHSGEDLNFTPAVRPFGWDQVAEYGYCYRYLTAGGRLSDRSPTALVRINAAGELVEPIGNEPRALQATAIAAGKIRLDWRYDRTGEPAEPTGFVIERLVGATYIQQDTVAYTGAPTYNWTEPAGLTHTTTYSYRVHSYKTQSDGLDDQDANTVTVTATADDTGPAAITGLTATYTG